MSTIVVPMTEAEFAASNDDLGAEREESIAQLESFLAKAQTLDFGCLDGVFSDLRDDVAAAVAEIEAELAEFVEVSQQVLSPGNPFWFYAAAEQWTAAKSELSSERFALGAAKATKLPANDSWKDPEVEWYEPMPDAQDGALEQTMARCTQVAVACRSHANSLVDRWISLFLQFSAFHTWIVVTVTTFVSADPTKWLDIVPEIAQTLMDLKDLVVTFVADMVSAWAKSRDLVLGLGDVTADGSAFDGGQWPTIASFA